MEKYIPYVEKKGDPSAPALVFIHAFPLHSAMWDAQFEALSEKLFVVRYDIRGFGKSASADTHFTIEQYVDDLVQMLDELALKNVVLCGLSMGGYIAMRFAERHPERLRGLILADTKSEADSNEAKIKRAQAVAVIKGKGLEAFLKPFIQGAVKNPAAHADKLLKWGMESSPDAVMGALLALAARTDTTGSLTRFTFPALIIVGENDTITPPDQAERLARTIPGATLVKIDSAGHLSNLEQPQKFTAVIQDFISKRLSR